MELPSLRFALRVVLRTSYLAALGCKHIANANKLAHIRSVNASMGMETPLLVTPFELLENRWRHKNMHGRSYRNLAQLRAAVATFVHTCNHHWHLEKFRYQSPVEARLAFHSAMPLAA